METRVIKFRVWVNKPGKDGFKGIMIPHEYAIQSGYFIDALNGKYPLMQFTGLTDKNGKEIYEGDIVNFHYFYGGGGIDGFVECEHELTGTVCWGIFGWALDAIKGEHWKGYTGYNEGEGHSSFMQLCYMNESGIHEESFEIKGNIHEHPYLFTPNN